MEKICSFYNTPTGCDRGNSCGFFHLTEAALERVTVAKRINTHAYSHLCTSSVLGTCRKPNCEYLHPKDDSRYKSSIIYRREVFDDNRFLFSQVETLEKEAKDMRSSAKKDREYIDSLRKQRKELRCDLDRLKKESDKYLDSIRNLSKQSERLLHTTRKTGSNNRYLRGKICRLKEDHRNSIENFSGKNTIVTRRYLDTKYDGDDDGDGGKDDPIETNADFIPLGLSVGAGFIPPPPPLSHQGNEGQPLENTRHHKKRKRYFDTVEIFPRTTRNGKRF